MDQGELMNARICCQRCLGAADIKNTKFASTLNNDKIFVRKCWRDNWNMKPCVWQTRFSGPLRQFISLDG